MKLQKDITFCTVYFGSKENNAVTLPHSAQRKQAFLGKIKEMSKKKKLPASNKIALELLHKILGHRSTRSLLAGDTANVLEQFYFCLVIFFVFDNFLISPKNACFLCALCGNVTAFFSFSLKYTVQNPFGNKYE